MGKKYLNAVNLIRKRMFAPNAEGKKAKRLKKFKSPSDGWRIILAIVSFILPFFWSSASFLHKMRLSFKSRIFFKRQPSLYCFQ